MTLFYVHRISPEVTLERHEQWDKVALRCSPHPYSTDTEWWLNADQLRTLAHAAMREAEKLEKKR